MQTFDEKLADLIAGCIAENEPGRIVFWADDLSTDELADCAAFADLHKRFQTARGTAKLEIHGRMERLLEGLGLTPEQRKACIRGVNRCGVHVDAY